MWHKESARERSESVWEDRSFFSSKFQVSFESLIEYVSLLSSTHEVIPGGELSIDPGRDRVLLEGCGCFLLFQGAAKAGRAFLLNRPGQYYYNLHIIGSIYKQVRKTMQWVYDISCMCQYKTSCKFIFFRIVEK